MATTKWLDRSQPQTLYIATIVMYFNAAFGVLGLLSLLGSGLALLLQLVFVAGSAAAGWGIANEKKLLYYLAVLIAVLPLAEIVVFHTGVNLLNLLFEIALIALLLHPMSRSYFRTWFR